MQKTERIVFIASLFGLILTAIFSIGYHHPDEHFQILEFAGLKLGLTTAGNLPWEYHFQLRPSIQPAIVVVLYKLITLFGVKSPFTIALILRLLSAFLAYFSMYLVYRLYAEKIKDKTLKHWFLMFSFFLWFSFYIGAHFSSENWSGIFFTIAFCLYFLVQKRNALFYLAIGLMLGFSFLLRYQAGFLVLGFLSWIVLIKKEKIRNTILLFSGVLLFVFLGILVDRWFYGNWTLTMWNYLDQNLLQDKVSTFGVYPWWWYIAQFFVQGIPPLSILFMASMIVLFIFKPKSPITWSLVPFLAIHFIIGHKEMRFLFPIVYFLPIILIEGIRLIQERYIKDLSSNRYLQLLMKISLILNFIFLFITFFKPAGSDISLCRKIYNDYEIPTSLYYTTENPYHGALDIYFYKRKNLSIKKIGSVNAIAYEPNKATLIAFTNKNKPIGFNGDYKLVYASFPGWILNFDLNNWQERTNIWYVYEFHPSENQSK